MTFQKIIIDFDRCDFNLFRSEFLKSTVWSDNFYRNINLTINNLMSLWLISDMARYTSETSPFWVIIFNSEWLISYMYNCSAYAGWIHLWGNCLIQYHIIWWRVKLYKSKIAFAVNLLFQILLKVFSEWTTFGAAGGMGESPRKLLNCWRWRRRRLLFFCRPYPVLCGSPAISSCPALMPLLW